MGKGKRKIPKKLRKKLGGKKQAKKKLNEMDQIGDLLNGLQGMMGNFDPSALSEIEEQREQEIEEKYKNLFNIKMIKINPDAIMPKQDDSIKPYNEVYIPNDIIIDPNSITIIDLGWKVKGLKEFEICFKSHHDAKGVMIMDTPNRLSVVKNEDEPIDEYNLVVSILNPFSCEIALSKGSPIAYMYIEPTPACSYVEVETFEIINNEDIPEDTDENKEIKEMLGKLENDVNEISNDIKGLDETKIISEESINEKSEEVDEVHD